MGASALCTRQMETHDVDPKGNTGARPETEVLGASCQLDAGEMLGPRLYLLEGNEVCCCFSRASARVSPPLIFLLLFSR